MFELKIVRVSEHPELTMGCILVGGVPKFVCVEPPWRDNRRNESCVPAGCYFASVVPKRGRFESWGNIDELIYVQDVPGRDGIYFHPANRATELRGCIAPGTWFGEIVEQNHLDHAVMSSTEAHNQLIQLVKSNGVRSGDKFRLVIV